MMSTINPWNGRPYSTRYYEILEKRSSLPVWQQKDEFLKLLSQNQTLILAGETGSGKTTQIPQFVLEHYSLSPDDFTVACTQPRRAAAMSVSRRVAEEMDVNVGEEVGYTIRFEDCSSSNGRRTVLKYLTDGMLLREAMANRNLERYRAIVLDEAHERSLATDVLFALLKKVMKQRPDLKLVVMSDTIEAAELIQGYFDGSALMKIPGRVIHPVEIFYSTDDHEPGKDYVDSAIHTVLRIHVCEPPGDILVFLTGEEEIEDACKKITEKVSNLGDQVAGPIKVVPLYSAIPQDAEGGPAGRKIFVATNIAETSLTIDGIVYVVDSGLSKQNVYDPLNHVESLKVSPISKTSARRRSELAGRTRPGKCFRLYSKESFDSTFESQTIPEIQRSNLTSTILSLKKIGTMIDLNSFDYMDAPAPDAVKKALEVLYYLGAIDGEGNLTKTGEMMSEFPLDPQMSKMLVVSPEFNCSSEILSICGMLSVPKAEKVADDHEAGARFGHIDGDHLTLLNVYHAYKQNKGDPRWCFENSINHRSLKLADSIRQQLAGIMARLNLRLCSTNFNSVEYYVNIRKAVLAGYFMQVAHLERRAGHYYCLTMKHKQDDQVAYLHPSSCLDDYKPDWVIYNECVVSTGKTFIRTVTDIRGEWLFDVAPHYFDLNKFPDCQAKHVLESVYHYKKKAKA
ncbi:OLC1v1006018C1 [Oldenlandia corymbosa var. corymbosa]|uniref:RNA helicase n=1 Tax=Oldenlandia corymbosa var. corymbosa TaxID=529605 RepID=A0AAV1DG48_OLDCO|nr:OLC1v1006018C1 [Oldenlandia corymbosa var. corymbosa]